MTIQDAIQNVTVLQGPAPVPAGLYLIGQYNAPGGWPIRIVGTAEEFGIIHDEAGIVYGIGSPINCYLLWRNKSTSLLAELLRNAAIYPPTPMKLESAIAAAKRNGWRVSAQYERTIHFCQGAQYHTFDIDAGYVLFRSSYNFDTGKSHRGKVHGAKVIRTLFSPKP